MKAKIIAAMAVLALALVGFAIQAEQADANETMTSDGPWYVLSGSGSTTTATVTAAASDVSITAVSGDTNIVTVNGPQTTGEEKTATFTITFVGQGTTKVTFSADGYTDLEVDVFAGVQAIEPDAPFVIEDVSATEIEIGITGVNATNETITVTSSNTDLVASVDNVTLANGAGMISFGLVSGVSGTSILTFKCGENALDGYIVVYAGTAVMQYASDNGLQAILYSDGMIYMDTSGMSLSGIPDVYFTVELNTDGAGAVEGTLVTGPMSAQKRMLIEVPGYVAFDQTAITTLKMYDYTTKEAIATIGGTAFGTDHLKFTLDKNCGELPAYKRNETTPFVEKYGQTAALDRAATVDTEIHSKAYTFLGWGATAAATEYLDVQIGEGSATPVAPTVEEYFFAVEGNESEDEYKIFAIWSDTFEIEIGNNYSGTWTKDGKVLTAAGDASTQVGLATSQSIAKSGDTILLRIQQTVPDNYKYAIALYDDEGCTVAAAAQAKMITNGIWQITGIDANLYVVVSASAYSAAVTGYNFAVDYIVNDSTTGKNGVARVSWDAVDYVPAGYLSMDGTYFRAVTGFGNVYGSFETLESLGKATMTVIKDNATATDVDKDFKQTLSKANGYNYDLILTTTNASEYYIYGVQGIWDVNADGDYSDTGDKATLWTLMSN